MSKKHGQTVLNSTPLLHLSPKTRVEKKKKKKSKTRTWIQTHPTYDPYELWLVLKKKLHIPIIIECIKNVQSEMWVVFEKLVAKKAKKIVFFFYFKKLLKLSKLDVIHVKAYVHQQHYLLFLGQTHHFLNFKIYPIWALNFALLCFSFSKL